MQDFWPRKHLKEVPAGCSKAPTTILLAVKTSALYGNFEQLVAVLPDDQTPKERIRGVTEWHRNNSGWNTASYCNEVVTTVELLILISLKSTKRGPATTTTPINTLTAFGLMIWTNVLPIPDYQMPEQWNECKTVRHSEHPINPIPEFFTEATWAHAVFDPVCSVQRWQWRL